MKTPFMHRRHFLQAVSGAALAFPWFSGLALQGADASKAPRRLVCIGMDFGVRPESFFPTGQGTNLELTPLLKPLERWQRKMTVFSQLEHPGVQGGHYGVHAFLSGVRREQAAQYADGCVTIDQVAEEHLGGLTRLPSLCLGVGRGDDISWTRSGIAVPKMEDPGAVFDLLFKPQRKTTATSRLAELNENESLLSLISQDAKRVATRLDRWDREKMDEFMGAMRDFERANSTNKNWLDKPLPVVWTKSAPTSTSRRWPCRPTPRASSR